MIKDCGLQVYKDIGMYPIHVHKRGIWVDVFYHVLQNTSIGIIEAFIVQFIWHFNLPIYTSKLMSRAKSIAQAVTSNTVCLRLCTSGSNGWCPDTESYYLDKGFFTTEYKAELHYLLPESLRSIKLELRHLEEL